MLTPVGFTGSGLLLGYKFAIALLFLLFEAQRRRLQRAVRSAASPKFQHCLLRAPSDRRLRPGAFLSSPPECRLQATPWLGALQFPQSARHQLASSRSRDAVP